MTKQNQQRDRSQKNIRQKTDKEENAVNDIISLRTAENASITNYKIKPDRYASLFDL